VVNNQSLLGSKHLTWFCNHANGDKTNTNPLQLPFGANSTWNTDAKKARLVNLRKNLREPSENCGLAVPVAEVGRSMLRPDGEKVAAIAG
jgi:hypothetical protein